MEKRTKINQLLSEHPKGTVLLSKWLTKSGYSPELQQRYRKSEWLESIGRGAMKRFGEKITYEGALYGLQNQVDSSIHPGGKSALELLGKAHYLKHSNTTKTLFGNKGEKLPAWFKGCDWGMKINYYSPSFLPERTGLTVLEIKNLKLHVSSAERAIIECLYLAPDNQDLLECYQLMEGLNNLRPKLLQDLLENCSSIKVKRLFLFLAEKADHKWFNYLKLDQIHLGTGKRSIVKSGVFIAKYGITVPKELREHE